jgi:hypothetical protein
MVGATAGAGSIVPVPAIVGATAAELADPTTKDCGPL